MATYCSGTGPPPIQIKQLDHAPKRSSDRKMEGTRPGVFCLPVCWSVTAYYLLCVVGRHHGHGCLAAHRRVGWSGSSSHHAFHGCADLATSSASSNSRGQGTCHVNQSTDRLCAASILFHNRRRCKFHWREGQGQRRGLGSNTRSGW